MATRAAADEAPPVSYSVELCAQCKRETLPQRRVSSLAKNAHRAPARDMVDRRAARVERACRVTDVERARHSRKLERRDKKRSLRSVTREIGILGAIKVVLDARNLPPAAPLSEDCPQCLKRRRPAA
jgi:hypothetical protein